MNYIFAVLGIMCIFNQLKGSPFAIDFPEKEIVTEEDYCEIQNQLRDIDIKPLLEELYLPEGNYTTFQDFYGRCTRGLRQALLCPNSAFFPSLQLEKIGIGSNLCLVSTVPCNKKYVSLLKTIPQALEANGFNGYFLYQIGGFPNPTGKEIQYAGVPYSFKIFMMLEAYKLGFNNVLWVDSAALPLRDPTPLFNWMDQNEALVHGSVRYGSSIGRYIFPATRQELQNLTGVDVLDAVYIATIVFGLKMDSERTKKLIQTYYQMVELGTPFLSCFPEEFVLTAIIGQADFNDWKKFHSFRLLQGGGNLREDTNESIEKVKNEGYFFYHRKH